MRFDLLVRPFRTHTALKEPLFIENSSFLKGKEDMQTFVSLFWRDPEFLSPLSEVCVHNILR